MRDPDLLESGLLAPGSCAAAEAAVLAATGGPHGVLAASLGWEADAVAVRGAVAFLEAADDAVRAPRSTGLDRQLALAAVTALARRRWRSTRAGRADRAPGPVAARGRRRSAGTVGALALGLLYGDPGRPVVTPYAAALPGSHVQPARCATWSSTCTRWPPCRTDPDSPANGTIEVQTITGPDGEVRHIVYLPGTDDFNAAVGPGRRRPRPGDQPRPGRRAARRLPAGHPRGDARGRRRPGRAGARSSGTPRAAWRRPRSWPADSGFHVTDVVTAGSPTAQVAGFPAGSHVLSLEQHGDVVPAARRRAQPRLGRADHGHLRRAPGGRRARPPRLRRLRAGRRAGRRLDRPVGRARRCRACTTTASWATAAR